MVNKKLLGQSFIPTLIYGKEATAPGMVALVHNLAFSHTLDREWPPCVLGILSKGSYLTAST